MPDDLLTGMQRRVKTHTLSGETFFDTDTVTQAMQAAADGASTGPDGTAALTPRELEIVRMVAQGLRNRVIGERLVISESTVKVHLHNIYEKLGIEGRLELVLLAQQKGLV